MCCVTLTLAPTDRREWAHREIMFRRGFKVKGKEARLNNDLFMFGDVDEIPKPEAVRAIRNCAWKVLPEKDDCAALEGSFFYFSYSWYAGERPNNVSLKGCEHVKA